MASLFTPDLTQLYLTNFWGLRLSFSPTIQSKSTSWRPTGTWWWWWWWWWWRWLSWWWWLWWRWRCWHICSQAGTSWQSQLSLQLCSSTALAWLALPRFELPCTSCKILQVIAQPSISCKILPCPHLNSPALHCVALLCLPCLAQVATSCPPASPVLHSGYCKQLYCKVIALS